MGAVYLLLVDQIGPIFIYRHIKFHLLLLQNIKIQKFIKYPAYTMLILPLGLPVHTTWAICYNAHTVHQTDVYIGVLH